MDTPIAASEELGVDFQAATEASNASTPFPATSEVAHKFETIPSELAESIEETRRTLSDYGIGGGGIVGRMQELLEWTHLTTGLPWYLTIGAVVVTVRMALFPIMVRGISNNARMARIQPQMMDNIAKIKRAKEDGNQYEMQRLQLETKQLFVDNNCGPLRGLIPPLFQMPLFIIFFLAIRGMANAGLPDFSTGGIAWFTDLSAPDPYYVLPILSSAATLATLQVGEFGMPEKTGFAKGFISAIKLATPLIVWFTSSFPAVSHESVSTISTADHFRYQAVLVYWVTHNTFSILQTLILRLPAFKRWADIPDPPPRDPTKPRSNPLSFRQIVKDTTEAFAEVQQKAIERTEARMESQAPVTRQKAWDHEASAYEKRKKAAAAALQDNGKVAFDTTASAGVLEKSVTQVEGNTASTQRQAIKMTPAQAAEEARRIRVADARKRREQHRQRKSRL